MGEALPEGDRVYMKLVVVLMVAVLVSGCSVVWKSGGKCYAFQMISFGGDPCEEEREPIAMRDLPEVCTGECMTLQLKKDGRK